MQMKKLFAFVICAVTVLSMSVNTFSMEIMKNGTRGDDVQKVQKMLISLGYLKDGGADGIFGSKTEKAVLAFQQDNGLDATGMVGEGTYNALKNGTVDYEEVFPSWNPDSASLNELVDSDEYNMGQDETMLLGEPLDDVECGKSGKPAAIAREIGKRPVLAFGNSSGDFSMLNYAEGNPEHTGMGFFVVCDDTKREYGNDEKAAGYCDEVEKEGWTGISMANDWKTIYSDDVQKTALPGVEETLSEAA